MNLINNFILSEHILPQLVEMMEHNKTPLAALSTDFIKSHLKDGVRIVFNWSDVRISYMPLNKRYALSFVIFSQPEKVAQSKYGLIIEDQKCAAEQPRLDYYTLEESRNILENTPSWMICAPTANGRHNNYGTMEGLPTPYNFVKSVLDLKKINITNDTKSFWGKLFSGKEQRPKLLIPHKYDTCIISQTANTKISKVIEQLHSKKVDLGVMLGHRLSNGFVLVIDCFFFGPRDIEVGFGFDHDQLEREANRLSNRYQHPLSFIGFIHSQPDDYLSNIDEISAFEQVDEMNAPSVTGIISSNQGDKLSVYEFYQQNIANTDEPIWNYSKLKIAIDNSLHPILPKESLQLKQ